MGGEAKLVNQITKGDFEVFDVESIDETSGTLYFSSNASDDRQHHICSVKLDGSDFQILSKAQAGTHQASFAPDGKYYVDNFSATMTPPQMSFCRIGGACDTFWKSKSLDTLQTYCSTVCGLQGRRRHRTARTTLSTSQQ